MNGTNSEVPWPRATQALRLKMGQAAYMNWNLSVGGDTSWGNLAGIEQERWCNVAEAAWRASFGGGGGVTLDQGVRVEHVPKPEPDAPVRIVDWDGTVFWVRPSRVRSLSPPLREDRGRAEAAGKPVPVTAIITENIGWILVTNTADEVAKILWGREP